MAPANPAPTQPSFGGGTGAEDPTLTPTRNGYTLCQMVCLVMRLALTSGVHCFTTERRSVRRVSDARRHAGRLGVLGRLSALLGMLIGLSACGSTSVDDYQAREPAFEPEDFFNGALTAHGVVKDFSGTAIRHFSADIIGCWSGGVGTLDEDFVFDDGEQQKRVWTLTPNGDQTYIGTAGDVVGEGLARWQGNAMFLDYTLRIELEDGPINVKIDDRMYRLSDNVVINESKMRKFGFGVGEILLTIIRHPDQAADCPSV